MRISLLAAGFLLAGCMVGPDYQRPEVEVPSEFGRAEAPTSQPTSRPVAMVVSGAAVEDAWWKRLRDPLLDSLVDRALASNLQLQIAVARVVEARALRRVTAADLLPQANTTGGYSYRGTSLNAMPQVGTPSFARQVGAGTVGQLGAVANAVGMGNAAMAGVGSSLGGTLLGSGIQSVANRAAAKLTEIDVPRDQNLFQSGFDATWEIDLFGGLRRAVQAAEANIVASEEDLHDLTTTLIAEVARNYVEARTYQKRLAVARKNIETQKESVELTRAKFNAGLTSELDVAQAVAQLANTSSQVPRLETLWFQAVHRLSVLLGRNPGALLAELEETGPIPVSPPEVPVGLPSELLRRRADIRRAERDLALATANIGVATADLYPRFSITGAFGTQTHDMQYFLDRNSAFWSIGPSFRWPIFAGGRIRGNIAVQEARQQQAFVQYHQAILSALEEVENSLIAYRNEQVRYEHLETAVNANQRAVDIASERYVKGLTDFLRVLESERSLYVTEDQLIQSEAEVVSNYIALHKALGGGWQAFAETPQTN